MAIKLSLKKLELEAESLDEFVLQLRRYEIEVLPITVADAVYVERLPQGAHKDPFDRLIAAQCLRLDLTLVSADAAFDAYGVRRVW